MVTKITLANLPDIDALRKLSQSPAMLDAITSPKWEYRYYSFNSKWADGKMMASMRDGSGGEYFILFDTVGAAIKGFDHESAMSPYANSEQKIWPGVLDDVPKDFANFLQEPAFSMQNTTFCIWRRHADAEWNVGNIQYPVGDEAADGSEWLLEILDNNPQTYQLFAQDYYQEEIPSDAVERIYARKVLSDELVRALNSEMSLDDLKEDADEIGYPVI